MAKTKTARVIPPYLLKRRREYWTAVKRAARQVAASLDGGELGDLDVHGDFQDAVAGSPFRQPPSGERDAWTGYIPTFEILQLTDHLEEALESFAQGADADDLRASEIEKAWDKIALLAMCHDVRSALVAEGVELEDYE